MLCRCRPGVTRAGTKTFDAVDSSYLDTAQSATQAGPDLRTARGQQSGNTGADKQTRHGNDALFPPRLIPASSDLPLYLTHFLCRIALQAAQTSTHSFTSLGPFIRGQQNSRSGTQGSGQDRQGDKSAAVSSGRSEVEVELDVVVVFGHLSAFH